MIEFIITSSVLIIVIIALRALFRGKISRRLQYALWGLVLLRLLMPVTLFGSSFSIMNMIDGVSITKAASQIQIYSDMIRNTEMTPEEAKAIGSGVLHEIQGGTTENGDNQLRSYIFTDALDVVLGRILGSVWLIGSIAAGLWFLGANIVFYKKLKKSRKLLLVGDGKLPVYLAAGLYSPCLFGILHPAIYLTSKAVENETSTQYVLAHEQGHYRHGDHIWSVLRGLCLAVWWWNPLVWTAALLSRTDSEMACDEAVIRQLGEVSRLEYGRTIIDMIAVKKERAGLMCTATAMSLGKKSIKKRLNTIIRKPKTVIPAVAAVLLIAAVCVGCTFTGAKVSPDPTKSNTPATSYAQQLYDIRNPYIGDASADGALLKLLGVTDKIGQYTIELDTKKEPYVLRVVFNDEFTDAAALNAAMNDHAMLLLALIENVSEIQWQYHYFDKEANGNGEFTGALTAADATTALNGTDIKNFGKSAADVQALLDWMDSDRAAQTEYTLMKLGLNGVVVSTIGPLSGDDAQLAGEVIFNYMIKSAAWPGVEIQTLTECYLLRAAYPDGTSSDYYAYLLDGSAVMQNGIDGRYSRIDDGLYEKLAGLASSGTSTTEAKLEAAVSGAILNSNTNNFHKDDFAAEAHTTLGVEADGSTTTVYAMAMFLSFDYADGGLSETGGSHMPVAIMFEKNNAGEYTLKEYWTPQDGSYYSPSIKEKFPPAYYNDALDTQKYVMGHIRSCYAQAIEFGKVPVDTHLGRIIDTICSSPAASSNPGDYIKAHPIEYREMLYYSTYTLDYCFALFEQGGQTGLQGHIMASACMDILGEAAKVTTPVTNGQQWYDAYKKLSPQT